MRMDMEIWFGRKFPLRSEWWIQMKNRYGSFPLKISPFAVLDFLSNFFSFEGIFCYLQTFRSFASEKNLEIFGFLKILKNIIYLPIIFFSTNKYHNIPYSLSNLIFCFWKNHFVLCLCHLNVSTNIQKT